MRSTQRVHKYFDAAHAGEEEEQEEEEEYAEHCLRSSTIKFDFCVTLGIGIRLKCDTTWIILIIIIIEL